MRKPWGLVWVSHVLIKTSLTRSEAQERLQASLRKSLPGTLDQPLVGVLNGDELVARGFPLYACSSRPTFVGRLEEGPQGMMLHGRLGIFALPYAILVVALPLARNAYGVFMIGCIVIGALSDACYRRDKKRLLGSLSRALECSHEAV